MLKHHESNSSLEGRDITSDTVRRLRALKNAAIVGLAIIVAGGAGLTAAEASEVPENTKPVNNPRTSALASPQRPQVDLVAAEREKALITGSYNSMSKSDIPKYIIKQKDTDFDVSIVFSPEGQAQTFRNNFLQKRSDTTSTCYCPGLILKLFPTTPFQTFNEQQITIQKKLPDGTVKTYDVEELCGPRRKETKAGIEFYFLPVTSYNDAVSYSKISYNLKGTYHGRYVSLNTGKEKQSETKADQEFRDELGNYLKFASSPRDDVRFTDSLLSGLYEVRSKFEEKGFSFSSASDPLERWLLLTGKICSMTKVLGPGSPRGTIDFLETGVGACTVLQDANVDASAEAGIPAIEVDGYIVNPGEILAHRRAYAFPTAHNGSYPALEVDHTLMTGPDPLPMTVRTADTVFLTSQIYSGRTSYDFPGIQFQGTNVDTTKAELDMSQLVAVVNVKPTFTGAPQCRISSLDKLKDDTGAVRLAARP